MDTEASLPNKHLIAQGFSRSAAAIREINPRVSVLNFHAEKPDAVRLNYHWNRVVAFDETGDSDQSDRKYRTGGWDWIMSGGGVYDHLDFSFTIERPDGSSVPLPPGTPGGGGPALRQQLGILKKFIESFDFIRLKPDESILQQARITGGEAGAARDAKATARALADSGKAVAIYVNGGTRAELVLNLPPGRYETDWVNPRAGGTSQRESFRHPGGTRTLISPDYIEDIALRVMKRD